MSRFPLFQTRKDATSANLWTISELTGKIRATLQGEFPDVGVVGEISGLARPASGHFYFSLKDSTAQIRAVMWKSTAQRVVFDLSNGLAVRAWGALEVYQPRGEYQLVIRKIEPEGMGALDLAFQQLVAKLEAEGLFHPARKRTLPKFPRRIVVITSPTGAAVRDFVQSASRRWPLAEILIASVRVQGQGAAEEVVAAIALANRVASADFVVLARGGGSIEDLWAFNEEIVARAIFASQMPVVSAIGHEVDVTISDLVADVRALTPTDAGSRCVPDAAELRETLDLLGKRMGRSIVEPVKRARLRLESLEDRINRSVKSRIDRARDRLNTLGERSTNTMRLDLARRSDKIAAIAAQLDALSPLKVLSRGYSITLKEDGATVVRSAEEVKQGDLLQTRLGSGTVESKVVARRSQAGRDEP